MKRASIDIGSNSILLLIVETDLGPLKVLHQEAEVVGLGTNIDLTGELSKESMDRAIVVLSTFVKEAENFGILAKDIIATGTEAFRVAKNSLEFLKRIKLELNLSLNILSSFAESYYSAIGVYSFHKNLSNQNIMDLGGASTELIKIQKNPFKIMASISIPLGSVRASDWKGEINLRDKIKTHLKELGEKLVPLRGSEIIICIAGTMTTIGAILKGLSKYSDEEVSGFEFSLEELSRFSENLEGQNAEDILSKYPFVGKRSKTLRGGAILAYELLNFLEIKKIIISIYGLRFGTITENVIPDQFLFKDRI